LSEAGEKIYSFVWDYFCDWYLELSKGEPNLPLLVESLRTILKLLHPYCPFVTEELWSEIKPEESGLLISEEWPEDMDLSSIGSHFKTAHADLQKVIGVITAIRKLRTDQAVEPGKQVPVVLVTIAHKDLLEGQAEHIKRLAKLSELTIGAKPDDAAAAFLDGIEIYLPLAGLVDKEKEKATLTKEKENLERFAKGIEAKLGNEQFVSRAPAALIEEQKQKLAEAQEKLAKIDERLKAL
jgi:valyl-tRNA synthetase